MRCSECIENIDLYIDNMLDEVEHEEMRAHMESCESCKSEYEEIRSIVEGLGELQAEPLPKEFDRMLRERLESERALTEEQPKEKFNNNIFAFSKIEKRFSYLAASIIIIAGGYSMYKQIETAGIDNKGGEIAIIENSDPGKEDLNIALDETQHNSQPYNKNESYLALENEEVKTDELGKRDGAVNAKEAPEVQTREIQRNIDEKPKDVQPEVQGTEGENSWQMAAESAEAKEQIESAKDGPNIMSLANEPEIELFNNTKENSKGFETESKSATRPTVFGMAGGINLDMENYDGKTVETGTEGTITVISERTVEDSNIDYDAELFELVKGETADGKVVLHFIPKKPGQSQIDILVGNESGELIKTSIKIIVKE